MDDLYSYLIGGEVPAGKQTKAVADALRRRSEMGQLAQLTGDKVLAPLGAGMGKQADEYADALQKTRQFGIESGQRNRQLDQTNTYQTGQLEHMKGVLDETHRGNTLDHIYQMMMAQAAQEKAAKTGTGGKIPKLRQGDIKDLQDMSQTLGAIKGLDDFIKEGGNFGAVEVGGHAIPGARGLKNTMAAYGMGSDADKKSYLAKQTWDRLYTLAERNRLFGATLTNNEQKSWRDANPTSNLTDKQIREALPIMQKVLKHRLDSKVSGLTKEGYNPEAMADYADVPGVNLPQAGDSIPASAPASGGSRRVAVDEEGNIISVDANGRPVGR